MDNVNSINFSKSVKVLNRLYDGCENYDSGDRDFLSHWKTYLAMALIDDLGRKLADDISSVMSTILSYDA